MLMTTYKRSLPEIQLVVFDLDGTLADTKADLALSVNAMREYLGLSPLSFDLVTSYIGHGVRVLMRRVLGSEAPDSQLEKGLAFFLDYYSKHLLDNTVAYPGVREALEGLGDRKLAVLTNKNTDFSHEVLDGLELSSYFFEVCGGDSFTLKKPDPMGIQALMSRVAASAEQTLMVGDSDTDVLTGRNAGAWTCGVAYGFAPQTLEKAAPDLLLDDLRQLPPLLDGRVEACRSKNGGS
jgi:phosphoglycolate phosphatase